MSQSDACYHINGESASANDLAPLAFTGHAHFTALQVRQGKIRGWDLHLTRLQVASKALFAKVLDETLLLSWLNRAIEKTSGDVSVVITTYSTSGEFTSKENDAPLKIMIKTSPPYDGPMGPLKLQSFEYRRVLPELKHVGEVAKTAYMRKAVENGFDDALFVDSSNRVLEASIWNLAFWDGSNVVWPRSPKLQGTTMSILQRQLTKMGIPQRDETITLRDLGQYKACVVMNSWTPGVTVSHIDETAFSLNSDFENLLRRAFQQEPLLHL